MARKPRTARVVLPNAGVEAWYRQQLDRVIDQMSASVLYHLRAAWKEAEPDHGFASDANPSTLLKKALSKWGGLWTRKLNKLSSELSKKFTDRAFTATQVSMAAAFKAAGFTLKFKATPASRAAYQAVAAENVALIKSIPQEYLVDVQQAVWASVMKGGDLSTLSKEVGQKHGIAKRRAALIARDQNNKAKAVIENVRRMEAGVKQAVWWHSHAGKVPRPTHVAMAGKVYNLKDGMYDADPRVAENIWPGQLINCRCSSSAIIPGLEEENDF